MISREDLSPFYIKKTFPFSCPCFLILIFIWSSVVHLTNTISNTRTPIVDPPPPPPGKGPTSTEDSRLRAEIQHKADWQLGAADCGLEGFALPSTGTITTAMNQGESQWEALTDNGHILLLLRAPTWGRGMKRKWPRYTSLPPDINSRRAVLGPSMGHLRSTLSRGPLDKDSLQILPKYPVLSSQAQCIAYHGDYSVSTGHLDNTWSHNTKPNLAGYV